MFGKQPLIHLFFLVASHWSLICAGAPTSLVCVYRAEARSPAEIQQADGFLPKGESVFGAIAPDTSLSNHAKAVLDGSSRDGYGYVFTSSSVDVAERFIAMRPFGYVYKIHVAAHMIDCIGTLGKYNPLDNGSEYTACGGIKFEQIMSWKAYENGKFGEEEFNKDFIEKVYGTAVAGDVRYQLAGLLENRRGCENQPGKRGDISKRRFGLGSLKSGFGALKSIKGVKSVSNVGGPLDSN
ncbi:cholera a subunit [Colletotrichum kahawae]|uniref:Cholera a subunit n=1 Tax=Colletotrichum kahawae TaxID=34407 RepID=A0AAE0D251_COLKA|nr:cholera a subunit [Colletotrichum kahawae]